MEFKIPFAHQGTIFAIQPWMENLQPALWADMEDNLDLVFVDEVYNYYKGPETVAWFYNYKWSLT